MSLRTVDVFAGCGGLTRGLADSGHFVADLAIEADRDAAETFAANFETDVVADRIEALQWFPRADVLVGGPPCQPFSSLNRSGVGSERRGLWREYLRALDGTGADAFLMENVPGLLASSEYQEFAQAATFRGFLVQHRILDAADFGVPQRRSRAIVIGTRGGAPFSFPTPTHGPPGNAEGIKEWRTFRDATVGLPPEPDGVNWHRPRSPRKESVIRYRAVPPDGGNRFEMEEHLDAIGLGHLVPACWRRKRSGTTDVFGRLWWDRPACTIRTEFYKPEKGRYLHPHEDRSLTIREGARLMSFRDDFGFPESQSMTSVGKQIGNAVPPMLAAAIGHSLAAALSGAAMPGPQTRMVSESV